MQYIIEFLFHIICIIISYIDYKSKIIPDFLLIPLLIISIIKYIFFTYTENLYISISIFCLPLFIIMIIEQQFSKELIGLGDVKYIFCLSIYFNNNNLEYLHIFYNVIIISSFIIYLFFFKGEKYMPLAPSIYISILFWSLYAKR